MAWVPPTGSRLLGPRGGGGEGRGGKGGEVPTMKQPGSRLDQIKQESLALKLGLVTGPLEDKLRVFSLGVTSRKSPTAYNYLYL